MRAENEEYRLRILAELDAYDEIASSISTHAPAASATTTTVNAPTLANQQRIGATSSANQYSANPGVVFSDPAGSIPATPAPMVGLSSQ